MSALYTCNMAVAASAIRILGDSLDNRLSAGVALPGGRLVVAGETTTSIGDLDGWLLLIDANGDVLWSRTLGGQADDSFTSVTLAANGDLVAAGSTRSYGAGGSDAWVVRLQLDGVIVWQKSLGQPSDDFGYDVAADPVGGFVMAGVWGPEAAAFPSGWFVDIRENGTTQREMYGPVRGLDSSAFATVSITADRGLFLGGWIKREGFVFGSRLMGVSVTNARRYRWNAYAEQNSFPSRTLASLAAANGDVVFVGMHGDPTPGAPHTDGVIARPDPNGQSLWGNRSWIPWHR